MSVSCILYAAPWIILSAERPLQARPGTVITHQSAEDKLRSTLCSGNWYLDAEVL